jgi:hypothetical protein
VRIWPQITWRSKPFPNEPWFVYRDLLELKWYDGDAPTIHLPLAKCLSALAYRDYFPERPRLGNGLRTLVSGAVLAASPGWCGTFGPFGDSVWDVSPVRSVAELLAKSEGNYDMSEMHLLFMAYRYYDALSPEARERLITQLLACGRVHRLNCDDTVTSGHLPDDWTRAGHFTFLTPPPFVYPVHKDIGETENHILMITTAYYLTNQLLYQRDQQVDHDNRRNGSDDCQSEDWPSCTALLLCLLRNMLRDDFSEYNAKNYQEETRSALLNLCSFAYDHEVRLAARMVLDYISARIVVSSNDLRRMVPFRRRNEGAKVAHDPAGFMTVALLPEADGSDPMTLWFAIQAGNTRAFEDSQPPWSIKSAGIPGLAMEALSDYRLPWLLHDLFVNDLHRRFFQRLHRTVRSDEPGGNRNADNMEIYAGSPSYLIVAGGAPSDYAIDPHVLGIVFGPAEQQLGVAVTTSFVPTGSFIPHGFVRNARDLIQFGVFAVGQDHVFNYGVAPDFACGHNPYFPDWVCDPCAAYFPKDCADGADDRVAKFRFVDRSPALGRGHGPGFYLAIYEDNGLALVEAFDTWLHPDVTRDAFACGVLERNVSLTLSPNEGFSYTTANGNLVSGIIWQGDDGAMTTVEYEDRDAPEAIGDAGNVTDRFLNGTILNSPAEAVVELTNPYFAGKIILDMNDPWHPRRVDENGQIEVAGGNHEVWLDFDWEGSSEGDVCRPFSSLAGAVDAVADGGVIRIVPSTTTERPRIGGRKRIRLVAPVGGVIIGARDKSERLPIAGEGTDVDPVRQNDIWVQFDYVDSRGNVAGPFNNLSNAMDAVADGGVIRIVPGCTPDRLTLGRKGKRFSIRAPIGGVEIGAKSCPPA